MPHKDPATKKKYFQEYYQKNKDSLKEYRSSYRKSNPVKEAGWQSAYLKKSTEFRRSSVRFRRYGVSPDRFEEMLQQQGGKCACCGNPFSKTPHVDHCHTTGIVRGLLCQVCNTGLGIYEKKQHLFKDYLERYPSGSITEDSE